MSPLVSVLIVNWNTRELLDSCLRSLETAEPPGTLEVIVVDNGSGDGSAEMVRSAHPDAVLVANDDNRGFAAAVNQADALATAPYRLLLNSDTVVPPGTIRGCLEHLRSNPGVAGVGCALRNADGSHQSSVFRFPSLRGLALNAAYLSQVFASSPALNWDRYGAGEWTEVRPADVVMGSFLLIRRDVVDEDRPLLDEGYFMYGEETDLCRRIVAAGERIDFHPGFAITHVHGASSRTAEQIAWSEDAKRRANLRFLRRWRRAPVAWLANLVMLLGLVPRSAGWALADAVDRLRGRPDPGRRRKAGSARFHLRALVRPSVMDEPWFPPPGPGAAT